MWETLSSHPLGRLSMRKYLRFATAFLVVCFLYIFATAPVASAADAEWSGSDIVYQQQTYSGATESTGAESHKLPKGTQIYTYTEPAGTAGGGSLQKAHLIYFPPGTPPGTATKASYQTYSLVGQNQYINPSQVTSISIAAPVANPGTTSCTVEGIGWIICPATNFLAKGMDVIYGWVDGFLEVRPLATTQDQALYRAWSYMRTFANIAFIIAFLVVIYSQISNIGLSNYDIKKMLPKLVIAAILVNTSYWICAIAVDIFNILGYSVQDLFIMMRNTLVGSEGNSWDVISWESMSALVLSGGSVVGGVGIATYLGVTGGALALAGATTIAGGLIFLLLPLLLSILFVVLMTFLILAGRQAIITILIIIAPLAFVAFLLPNTEKWFEKWRSTFFTLLLLFPAFSLVFGGSQLAAAAIIQNSTSINTILLGMAVQVAPLAITPLLLKLGGGVLNRFAGIVNNPTKGIFDRGKNWAKERNEQHRAGGLAALDRRAKDRGFVNGVPTTGNRRQRSRFNPNNMAYRREYNRRERAGMKTANEALSEGLFVQTGAGRRIHNTTKDAGLEKHYGEGANLEAYNNAVYGTPGVAGSGDPYRQHLHHAAHTATGRAKLTEDQATADAEDDLQAQILSDRALRQLVVQTNESKKRAETAQADVQGRADAHWQNLAKNDPGVRAQRLSQHETSQSAKRAEEQWNTIISNIEASGSAAPNLNVGEAHFADSIQKVSEQLAAEAYAKANAETEKKERLTRTMLENTQLIDGVNIRDYAGGIRGDAGAESVLASAIATSRKEYGEKIAEKAQLIKHFNLSSQDRQSLAMGIPIRTSRRPDGSEYDFRVDDDYVREAVIEQQLKAGSFGDIEAIIASSGVGQANEEYRTTISDAIVTNGLSAKALYFGAKTIDDVAQGRIIGDASLNDAALYHIREGKIRDEVLASQSPLALRRMFEIGDDPNRAPDFANLSPAEQQRFRDRAQALRESAKIILEDEKLRARADNASIAVFEQYRAP